MEKMNDLRDLLLHEIYDIISAEDQMIANMPAMIEKAKHSELKRSLKEHLEITKKQRKRLDEVLELMNAERKGEESGLLSRLFKRSHVCKGMEGILEEGKKMMSEDMHPDVMDAAIIAAAQKAEHYEICSYGTARAYAEELQLKEVEGLLLRTLDEEYDADEYMTKLAVNRVNKEAEGTSASSSAKRSTPSKEGASRQAEAQPASASRTNTRTGASRGAASRTGATSTSGASRTGSATRSSSGRTSTAKTAKTGSSSGRGGSTGRSNSKGR